MSTWLILFVLFILVELCTVNLVTIWFALGALFAFVASLFTDSVLIQTTIFVIGSALSLIFTRPVAKKYILPKTIKTNFDKLIGMVGVVTEEITKTEIGEVKVDGKRWSAKSNKEIKVGSKVEILSIEGVKLIVKEKEEDD